MPNNQDTQIEAELPATEYFEFLARTADQCQEWATADQRWLDRYEQSVRDESGNPDFTVNGNVEGQLSAMFGLTPLQTSILQDVIFMVEKQGRLSVFKDINHRLNAISQKLNGGKLG